MSNDNVTTTTQESLIGRVKWFNSKAGYGFITVSDGVRAGTDVFVHHSAINVNSQQYKYLVQGEYLEFNLVTSEGGKHEYQASSVSGINAGKLMCETRQEFKVARRNYKTARPYESEEPAVVMETAPTSVAATTTKPSSSKSSTKKTQTKTPNPNGEGPRSSWNVVEKKTSTKRQTSKPSLKNSKADE
jgi:CspA family cold shock protein